MTNESEYIRCVGEDGKIHICKPHEDVCNCGVKVLTKVITKQHDKLFSCYECTY